MPAEKRPRAVIFHVTRDEVADFTARALVTPRGKEVDARDTVSSARRLLTSAVQVLPVLGPDGRYLGAVNDETLAAANPAVAVSSIALELIPTAGASDPAPSALEKLDAAGASRLVVLDDEGRYTGIICLRGDRRRLCVDPDTLDSG